MVTLTMYTCLTSPQTKNNGKYKGSTVRIAHALLTKMITTIRAMVDGTRTSAVAIAAKMRILAAMIVRMNMIIATRDCRTATTAAKSLKTRMLINSRAKMAVVPKANQMAKRQRFRTKKAITRGACAMMRKRRSGNAKQTIWRRPKLPRNVPTGGHAPRA